MPHNRTCYHVAHCRKVRHIGRFGKVGKSQQRVYGVETDVKKHTEMGLIHHCTSQDTSCWILGKRDWPQCRAQGIIGSIHAQKNEF